MQQCDGCAEYKEDVDEVFVDCFHSDGSGEVLPLCSDCVKKKAELYPPCPDQDYRDAMQQNQDDLANGADDEIEDDY